MSRRKYRVDSIEIEGFRGFTSRRTVRFEGKSAFLFGPNGFGKSSIVEAVRWCLFGGTAVENPVNDWYAGQCEVKIELLREAERYSIVRTQAHGARESDRPKVLGPDGSTQTLSDFAPNLKDFGEKGTRFILAGQGPRERAEIRLEDFDRVLGAYIGFSPVGTVGSDVERHQGEHDVTCSGLESQVKHLVQDASNLRSRLLAEAKELDAVNAPITTEDLQRRVWEFSDRVHRISLGMPALPPTDAPLETILAEAGRLLESGSGVTRFASKRGDLEADIGQIAEAIRMEGDLDGSLTSTKNELDQLNSDLAAQLALGADNALEAEARRIDAQIDEQESSDALKAAAARYCLRHGFATCPVCANAMTAETRSTLENEPSTPAGPDPTLATKRGELQQALQSRSRLASGIREAVTRRNGLEQERAQVAVRKSEMLSSLATKYGLAEGDLTSARGALETRLGEVQLDERTANELVSQRKVELAQLRSFLRRFALQEKAASVDRFSAGQEILRASHLIMQYRKLLTSAHGVSVAIEKVRRVELAAAIPAVQREIDVIYPLLTSQRSYPQARLRFKQTNPEDPSWGLALEVGRLDRQVWFSPESRLNNQAWNALHILLFLVFGRLGLLDHELDLFIVDDPSQSFDKGHLRSLLQLVSHVSESTQVILATHDEEVYRPLVTDLFKPGRITIVNVTDFDPDSGPTFANEI